MGSDLYMEQQAFRPRPNKAEWTADELLIYGDTFYHGWSLIWRGNPGSNDESLLEALIGGPVPPKPEPLTPKEAFNQLMRELHSDMGTPAGSKHSELRVLKRSNVRRFNEALMVLKEYFND